MSRGIGSLQRLILDRLALGGGGLCVTGRKYRTSGPVWPERAKQGWVSSYELARSIRTEEPEARDLYPGADWGPYDPASGPTRSERQAVRRALRNLEARGLVEIMSGRSELEARLPITDEQREHERAEERQAMNAIMAKLAPVMNA